VFKKAINKDILKLAIPSIFANITVPLVGLADLAIIGHTGDAIVISAIAIGGMLFDMLYWNFGFLRLGTSGFTAQAYGRNDMQGAVKIFVEAQATAMICALLMLLLQFPVMKYAPCVVDISPEALGHVKTYFFTRIWAAPAVMSLFVIRGWFIGMQNAVSTMAIDITINVMNVVLSLLFAVRYRMGVYGIALGTVLGQYSGFVLGFVLLGVQYGKLGRHLKKACRLQLKGMKNFFRVNGDIFVRSLCMLVVYSGFTVFSSRFGPETTAVNTILLKLMMLYSYFLDGFAYAGEAMTGRYVGAKDPVRLKETTRHLFVWVSALCVLSVAVYAGWFDVLVGLITNDGAIIARARQYLGWVLIMPVVSCGAFLWDGIYIGATASVPMRNIMLVSVAFFVGTYYLFHPSLGVHAIWLAYILHLVVRTAGSQLLAKKYVYTKAGK
jgi:MATE family multidrug resistance protein